MCPDAVVLPVAWGVAGSSVSGNVCGCLDVAAFALGHGGHQVGKGG